MWKSRLCRILNTLIAAQLICLQGTRIRAHPILGNDHAVHSEFVSKYLVHHWHAGPDTAFTNSATGVSIAVSRQFCHPTYLAEVFSPPRHLQGRAGAVLYQKRNFGLFVASLYFPASGSVQDKLAVTEDLLSWLQPILEKLPRRTHKLLAFDGNARVGLVHCCGEWIPHPGGSVGPVQRERATPIGVKIADFLAKNSFAIVNTFNGPGGPTYWNWTGTASRIDYLAVPTSELPSVQYCNTWKRTGFQLQLAQVPELRDHMPLTALFQTEWHSTNPSKAKWNYDKSLLPVQIRKLMNNSLQRFSDGLKMTLSLLRCVLWP